VIYESGAFEEVGLPGCGDDQCGNDDHFAVGSAETVDSSDSSASILRTSQPGWLLNRRNVLSGFKR
jgi:hypothetical protein